MDITEKIIKEYCKRCVDNSNLNQMQKDLLKASIDAATNINELIVSGLLGLIANQ